jgi:hypothetical protein
VVAGLPDCCKKNLSDKRFLTLSSPFLARGPGYDEWEEVSKMEIASANPVVPLLHIVKQA